MDNRLRNSKSIQKLVPQTLAQMGVRNEACHVYQLDWDEAHAILALPTALFDAQLLAGTGHAHVGNAMIGIDGGEGVIRNIHIYQGRSLEKGGFAELGFPASPTEHIGQWSNLTGDAATFIS
jgi:hypothetical protein